MEAANIKQEIARLGPWLHDVEVSPGVRTGAAPRSSDPDKEVKASYSPDLNLTHIVESVFGGTLDGRSFLDCGCNAGGHSLAAARLGAGRGLAFDARQHWLDQAAFLARFQDAPQLEFRRLTLAELPALQLEPFDVTLFGGLFYHLPDPVAGLRNAADLTRELLIVNTSVRPRPYRGLELSWESTSVALSGVDGLAWLPTGWEVMRDILGWCGFPHVRIDHYWTPRMSGQPRGWRRLQILAARSEETFAHYDKLRPGAHPDRQSRIPPRVRGLVRRVRAMVGA